MSAPTPEEPFAPSRVTVVVPTYNEAENLEPLVSAVLAQDPRIRVLVVDDNSPDGTGKIADDMQERTGRVDVLHRREKEGLGAAYRAGIRQALDLGAEVVVQMDCDFSHPPDMLPTFLERIEHCDAVSGSRYVNGITVVNWPIERILISWFGNWYARKITKLEVTDITGGFRCARASLLEKTGFENIRSNGYGFQIEMNYRFARCDARFEEVEYFFVDRKVGDSKMSLNIAFEAAWIVWWMRIADRLGRL